MGDELKADVEMNTTEAGDKGSGSEPPAQNARQLEQALKDQPQSTRPTAKKVSDDDPTGQTSDTNTVAANIEGHEPGPGTIVNKDLPRGDQPYEAKPARAPQPLGETVGPGDKPPEEPPPSPPGGGE